MTKFKTAVTLFLLMGISLNTYSQKIDHEETLAMIRKEGFGNSKVMGMLSHLTDVYGHRLTGTREYLRAAEWISKELKEIGLQDVHFENFCTDCRGWQLNTFQVEMTAPNYMNISAYPMAMSKSTPGIVSGEVILIESAKDMGKVSSEFKGKLKGKVILLGKEPARKSLSDQLTFRYSKEQLKSMDNKLKAKVEGLPLPELFKKWEIEDKSDHAILKFAEAEGALAILTTRPMYLGVLHPQGTYFFRDADLKPLPYFTIMPEHFGRLSRMAKLDVRPTIRLNLETEFYSEPENNVNIIGEITGTDGKLKSEQIIIGGHFDSWHSATGATDNGANCVVLVEALRILKQIGYHPRRTIKIGLWGGEEQAFLGSAAYAQNHFGPLDKDPNKVSEKVSAYLNLDNGAGAIRGIYLQNNEMARPYFKHIFDPLTNLGIGAISIENTLSTDHETFDFYNIPGFQFIQDNLAYRTATHHTYLDFLEYVQENDVMKNAVIMAWTIYSLDQIQEKLPRKTR